MSVVEYYYYHYWYYLKTFETTFLKLVFIVRKQWEIHPSMLRKQQQKINNSNKNKQFWSRQSTLIFVLWLPGNVNLSCLAFNAIIKKKYIENKMKKGKH